MKHLSSLGAGTLVGCLCLTGTPSGAANLDLSGAGTLPAPASGTPVIAVDDTYSHGPVANDRIVVAVDEALLKPPIWSAGEAAIGLVPQVSLSVPSFDQINLKRLLDPYDVYELRVRGAVFLHQGRALGGPLTFAVQHYFPLDHLSFAPLAAVHFGLESAVATPWISGRFLTPPIAVRVLDGVDSELEQSGWSLRPVAGYLRADFLACRSIYVELGGAPEVFIPGTGPTEYDARFHVATGWSFTCPHRMVPYRPKVSLEYRGRVGLPTSEQAISYRGSLGGALQVDVDSYAVQLFASFDPGHADYQMVGIRIQKGFFAASGSH